MDPQTQKSRIISKLDVIVFIIGVIYVLLCPFTKVEESFGIQAIHDFLYHGVDLQKVRLVTIVPLTR
jgi:alpha-1,6-mannosyltransferase